jgi:hypothetical protein
MNCNVPFVCVKVKGVEFTLEQATKAERGIRGIVLISPNLGAKWGVGGQHHALEALSPGKGAGNHCTVGWVGPRAGLDLCGKSRRTSFRTLHRPAHSVSLYRDIPGLTRAIFIKFRNCEYTSFPHKRLNFDCVYQQLKKLYLKDNAQFCFISFSIRGIFVKIQLMSNSHVSCRRCICCCDRPVF